MLLIKHFKDSALFLFRSNGGQEHPERLRCPSLPPDISLRNFEFEDHLLFSGFFLEDHTIRLVDKMFHNEFDELSHGDLLSTK